MRRSQKRTSSSRGASLDPFQSDSNDNPALLQTAADKLNSTWEAIPGRLRLVALCSMAFMLCNMDKVNLSIAIMPMAQSFDWPSSVSGLIQSSFFWGYMLAQLPGGYLCSRFGGRRMIPYALGLWSFAAAVVPFVGGTVSGLCVARAAVGLGEAVAPSAITDMVARTVPLQERSRATSTIFAGVSVGSVFGLFFSSFLIEHFNWELVFLLLALGGTVWIAVLEKLVRRFASQDQELHQKLTSTPAAAAHVPVRAMLRSSAVWSLAFTHLCANYFHYTMLAWLPTFFARTLDLELSQAAMVSVIPPILSISFAAVAGSMADRLVEGGWETTVVRKICQSIAFLGPASCLMAASLSDSALLSAVFVTASLGLASFSMAGLYCNHQDLSPKYSSFLLGFTNTVASIPGVVGVWLTGLLLDRYQSWEIALFLPSVFFFLCGTAVFGVFGKAQEQSFEDDAPFKIERTIQALLKST